MHMHAMLKTGASMQKQKLKRKGSAYELWFQEMHMQQRYPRRKENMQQSEQPPPPNKKEGIEKTKKKKEKKRTCIHTGTLMVHKTKKKIDQTSGKSD